MYPISPVPKTYSWGSYDRLQQLFGVERDGPLAEMWFSGHAASPSSVNVDGVSLDLDEAIRRAPQLMVGTQASEEWGPVLPYLFKIISARIPLSLQVHPLDFEARAGFNRENAKNIPIDSPIRSFKDTLAKHEMVVALEPFEASVGFAPRTEQLRVLSSIDHPLAREMYEALSSESGVRSFFQTGPVGDGGLDADMPAAARVWGHTQRQIFAAFHIAVKAPSESCEGLTQAIRTAAKSCSHRSVAKVLDHVLQAADAFPGDPSVMCVAMLNPVHLEQGESVFIPAGTPHCYLHGTGAEIMTNSDNVLRAGMTPKHKDIPNLLHNLNCNPAPPIDPTSHMLTFFTPDLAVYRPRLREFMLSYGSVGDSGSDTLWARMMARHRSSRTEHAQNWAPSTALPAASGPRVLVCIDGRVTCVSDTQRVSIGKGEALFVPASDGRAQVVSHGGESGVYLLASTSV